MDVRRQFETLSNREGTAKRLALLPIGSHDRHAHLQESCITALLNGTVRCLATVQVALYSPTWTCAPSSHRRRIVVAVPNAKHPTMTLLARSVGVTRSENPMNSYARGTTESFAPAVTYVAGYGRSGSTLLDVLLSQSSNVIGTGELTFLFRQASRGGHCSCQSDLLACPLWGPLLNAVRRSGLSLQEAETVTRTVDCGLRKPTACYADLWALVLGYLSSLGAIIVVDSSKSGRHCRRRPHALARAGFEVTVLHLRRDPLDVSASVRSGTNAALALGTSGVSRLRVARAILGRFFADMAASSATRACGGFNLSYEGLVRRPSLELSAYLASLTQEVGSDAARELAKAELGEPLSAGHAIGGNRMRCGEIVMVKSG